MNCLVKGAKKLKTFNADFFVLAPNCLKVRLCLPVFDIQHCELFTACIKQMSNCTLYSDPAGMCDAQLQLSMDGMSDNEVENWNAEEDSGILEVESDGDTIALAPKPNAPCIISSLKDSKIDPEVEFGYGHLVGGGKGYRTRTINTCQFCRKEFRDLPTLLAHADCYFIRLQVEAINRGNQLVVDSNQWTFNCEFCAKEFKNLKNIQDHLVCHFDKTWICLICYSTMATGKSFKSHLRVHLGQSETK